MDYRNMVVNVLECVIKNNLHMIRITLMKGNIIIQLNILILF